MDSEELFWAPKSPRLSKARRYVLRGTSAKTSIGCRAILVLSLFSSPGSVHDADRFRMSPTEAKAWSRRLISSKPRELASFPLHSYELLIEPGHPLSRCDQKANLPRRG